MIFVWDWFRQM